jgi:putative redox protein
MSYTSSIKYKGGLRTEATHLGSDSIICTDAPIDNNGKGALFSPTDLTATSLASCMLTVMGIAAASDGTQFDNVTASVKKIMASNPRRISEIHVTIECNHEWTEKEKNRMQRIAVNCPVAKSLHSNIKQVVDFSYTG